MALTVKDFPFYGNTQFYVKACDLTGCGAEVSFTTIPTTPLPATTYGESFTNITDSGFDISFMPYNAIKPYTWPLPTEPEGIAVTILTGIIITAIFAGMWIRGKNTAIPSFAGALLSALFVYSNSGLQLGIPPEILGIGQGVFAACIAGLIMSIFKKG